MKNIIKVLFLSLLVSGCWLDSKEEETLYVLTSADYPPFSSYEKFGEGSELVGFDIDLAKRIALHLGKKIIIQDVGFSTLISQLIKQEKYIAISAISITPERAHGIDYSTPYYVSNIGVLRHKFADLDLISHFTGTLGVQLGSSLEEIAAVYQAAHPELSIKYYAKSQDAIDDLLARHIEGVLVEETPARCYAETYKWLLFFKPLQEIRLEYAVALPKGSALKGRINAILQNLQRSGVLAELQTKWFVTRTPGPKPAVAAVL